ncbi:histidine kinase [Pseudoflavitalea sp. X16]|uniref:sensor histidine kinase n=1 Tax=Paraflavitalea devenefica TaxID=2716334 RepID=UPI001424727B|nr:histidine kinase [Paraflavitalea devenefica]NII29184.1 histidine kinase [Paraflavitalea devenefica]
MLSFLKKYSLPAIAFFYFALLVMAALMEEYELYFTIAALFFTVFIFIPWLIWQAILVVRLRHERKKTELLHLKSQVNPHFFFNTLNNLYGLIKTDPKKAGELVLKLSDMMRYSIYEAQNEGVTLEKEVEYLNNYIELHKMRYHKKIAINFQVDIQEGYRVMPLLFIILLENAFKHGVENLREKAFVHLVLTTADNEIHFEIKNNFDNSVTPEGPGIGLNNLKRRLALAYENNYQLKLAQHNDEYLAELRLKNL